MDLFALCHTHPDFLALSTLPLRLDLRYAMTANLCGRDLYQGVREAWLHRDAWGRLEQACLALARRRPGWRIRVYDAARPLRVQEALFSVVKGTPQQPYVADPAEHSLHNYGLAVDAGLEDEAGQELDLGTPFDSFEEASQPRLEQGHLASGRLNRRQVDLRLLQRECFEQAGFRPHPLEWWHFEVHSLEAVRGSYTLLP